MRSGRAEFQCAQAAAAARVLGVQAECVTSQRGVPIAVFDLPDGTRASASYYCASGTFGLFWPFPSRAGIQTTVVRLATADEVGASVRLLASGIPPRDNNSARDRHHAARAQRKRERRHG